MIQLAAILVPFGFFLAFSSRLIGEGHQYFLVFAALLFLATWVRSRPIRWFFYYAAGWMIYVNLLVINSNLHPSHAMAAIGCAVCLIVGLAVYLTARDRLTTSTWLNLIRWSVMLQAVIGVAQINGYDPLLALFAGMHMAISIMPDMAVGTLGNTNFLAIYVAICFPLFWSGRWRYFAPVIVALVLVSNTTGAFVALAAAVLVCVGRPMAALPVFAAIVFYAACIDATNPALQDVRWQWWGQVFDSISASWQSLVFGFGPVKPMPIDVSCPIHNEWLTLWHYYGLIALSLTGAYLLLLMKKNRIILACIAATAAGCLSNYPMHLAPSAFVVLVLMGLMERPENG